MCRWFLCLVFVLAMPLGAQETDSPPASPPASPIPFTGPSALQRAGPLGPVSADPLAEYVDGLVEGLRREHVLPGVTLAVVRGGAPTLLRGYGHADLGALAPVDPSQSRFRIGSVSKTFVWTAALLLVDRGQLDLDADVNRYLKSFKVSPAFDEPVTMRQLMAHRAGFEDSFQVFGVADDDQRPLAELLAAHQPKRIHPPGSRTSYSNWGSALAAQLVADVAGEDYGSFLRRELLDPLGMRDTGWNGPTRGDGADKARLAHGYSAQGDVLKAERDLQLGAYWPAGGMSTTAADMARWMRFHLGLGEIDGRRLLSAETHALVWTRPYRDRADASDLTHGFVQTPFRGVMLTGHGGATGTFLTNLVLVPELGLGVFVSQSSTATRNLVQRLPEQIVERMQSLPPASALAADAGEPGALAETEGDYLSNRRVVSSFAAIFGAFDGVTLRAINSKTLAFRGGEYRRIGEDLFESAFGQRLALIRGTDGGVVAFADGSGVHSFERVGGLAAPVWLFVALGTSLLLAVATLGGTIWRLGRARGGGPADAVVGRVAFVSALCSLAFVGSLLAVMLALGQAGAAGLSGNYPMPVMLVAHGVGWGVAAASLAMLSMLVPAWTRTSFSFLRKLTFTLFTFALLLLTATLWTWRVIGAAVV